MVKVKTMPSKLVDLEWIKKLLNKSSKLYYYDMEVFLIAAFYDSKVAPEGAASMYTLVGVHTLWSWTSGIFSSGLPVTG